MGPHFYLSGTPQHLSQASGPVIYIGDGTTDRCPGSRADLLFAKGSLADWCEREGVEHVRWKGFGDVLDWFSNPVGEAWLDTLTAP